MSAEVERSDYCEWPVWNGAYDGSRYRSCGRTGASAVEDPYTLGLSLCWQHEQSLFDEVGARVRHTAPPVLLASLINAVPTNSNTLRRAVIAWINEQATHRTVKKSVDAWDIITALAQLFRSTLRNGNLRVHPHWNQIADDLLAARLSERWSA